MSASPKDLAAAGARELSRRRFLADAGVTALAVSIIKPELVSGTEASAKVDLGIIGCGGRGAWIADLFRKHGGYNIVALADYFPDRVDAAGNTLGVPAARRFTGLSAYSGCWSRSSMRSRSRARPSSIQRRRPTLLPPASTSTWPNRPPSTCPAV